MRRIKKGARHKSNLFCYNEHSVSNGVEIFIAISPQLCGQRGESNLQGGDVTFELIFELFAKCTAERLRFEHSRKGNKGR